MNQHLLVGLLGLLAVVAVTVELTALATGWALAGWWGVGAAALVVTPALLAASSWIIQRVERETR
jgi:hypothetical protein